MEPMWNNTSAFLEIFKELIRNQYVPTWIIGSYWGCDDDTYRFLEENGTASISCEQPDRGTNTRPSPSSKQQRSDEYIYVMQKKHPHC